MRKTTGTDHAPGRRSRPAAGARKRAAAPAPSQATLFPAEIARLLHELQVHQVELEAQNEELRRTQAALAASRERYVELYDLAPVGYLTLCGHGLIQEANLLAATLLGTERGRLVKRPFTRFILERDHARYYQYRKQLAATGARQECELQMLKCDGSTFWGHVLAVLAPDSGGAPGCHVVLRDITERKRAEEESAKLQLQLHQAQKMESVGRLAGGVAHDFNNMLGVILGAAELALIQLGPAHPLADPMQEIQGAAHRSAELTRQLLAFARCQPMSPKSLDLNAAVTRMLKMLRRLIGEDIELAWKPGAGMWPVKMDPSQVDQVLANLCVNARDAIAGAGQVTIETSNVVADVTTASRVTELVPGDYVRLSVCDSGGGIDQEVQPHIFEPFFTTKAQGKGTGLGLATVYGIVKQNGGTISVRSEPGQGSTFEIHFPRHSASVEAERLPDPWPSALGGQETVLLVEDEGAVLRTVKTTLESLGYRVLSAATPGEAIQLAAVHAGALHLLLTDIVMPEMNGMELSRQIQQRQPRIKVLLMSGYAAEVNGTEGGQRAGGCLLRKPFSRQELAVGVREVLDGPLPRLASVNKD